MCAITVEFLNAYCITVVLSEQRTPRSARPAHLLRRKKLVYIFGWVEVLAVKRIRTWADLCTPHRYNLRRVSLIEEPPTSKIAFSTSSSYITRSNSTDHSALSSSLCRAIGRGK